MSAVSYKLKGAAEATGISVDQIRKWVRAGELTAHKVGRDWVIRFEDLDRYIKNLPTVI
jgi:excisionase family DNA binding protein